MGIQIAPSILSADFVNLERDIAKVASADWLHVDVMDAHFVPNLTIGLPVVERIAQVSPLPLDVHLMISDPDHWAPRFAEAGAASVTFHWEATENPVAVARSIRATHARASVAIKPGTPVSAIEDLLTEVDMVLVMTVEPGFGGQGFMADMLPKIRQVKAAAAKRGVEVSLQVDGGISRHTIEQAAAAGADVMVAGSAIYGAENAAQEIDTLRELGSHAHQH